MFPRFNFFALNIYLMFFFSFLQTVAQVVGESASDTNGDLQKFIIVKQRKKFEEASSKLAMLMITYKRAVDRLEELQKRKKVASEK